MPEETVQDSSLKNEADETPVQVVKPEPLKTLFEWEAPVRAFRKPTKELISTIGAIIILVIVILAFAKEWFFIGAVIALSFLGYVFATIPAEKVSHKITNRGIITGGNMYRWDILSRYWFGEKSGAKILYVETQVRFPVRLGLFLGEENQEAMGKIMADYLPMEEPPKTWTDKAGDWLTKVIPLEKTS